MEDTIKAGDVWWNQEQGYGRIYLLCDPSYPKMLRMFLFHKQRHWENNGLTEEGTKISLGWVRLYNIQDVITLSMETINAEHST